MPNMCTSENMSKLCKLLNMPPRVRRFTISYDFNEGIVECQCYHIATGPDGKRLTDKEGSLQEIFSKGHIVWDKESNDEESQEENSKTL